MEAMERLMARPDDLHDRPPPEHARGLRPAARDRQGPDRQPCAPAHEPATSGCATRRRKRASAAEELSTIPRSGMASLGGAQAAAGERPEVKAVPQARRLPARRSRPRRLARDREDLQARRPRRSRARSTRSCFRACRCRAFDYYGKVLDGDEQHCWLFLEDAGAERYSPAEPEHRRLAARWLADVQLHAPEFLSDADLPDRGPRHYLVHLLNAREEIDTTAAPPRRHGRRGAGPGGSAVQARRARVAAGASWPPSATRFPRRSFTATSSRRTFASCATATAPGSRSSTGRPPGSGFRPPTWRNCWSPSAPSWRVSTESKRFYRFSANPCLDTYRAELAASARSRTPRPSSSRPRSEACSAALPASTGFAAGHDGLVPDRTISASTRDGSATRCSWRDGALSAAGLSAEMTGGALGQRAAGCAELQRCLREILGSESVRLVVAGAAQGRRASTASRGRRRAALAGRQVVGSRGRAPLPARRAAVAAGGRARGSGRAAARPSRPSRPARAHGTSTRTSPDGRWRRSNRSSARWRRRSTRSRGVHTAFAEHPLLPECRLWGGDRGIHFYSANVRDAIIALRSLDSTVAHRAARDALLRPHGRPAQARSRRVRRCSPRRAGPRPCCTATCGPRT